MWTKYLLKYFMLCWYELERDSLSVAFLPSYIRLQVRLSCDNMPFGVSVELSCPCMVHVIRGKKVSV